jgi:hypothetical protein
MATQRAAAAAASTFFSGFDMALLLGVLASILASNSRTPLHSFFQLVSANPAFFCLSLPCTVLSVDTNPARRLQVQGLSLNEPVPPANIKNQHQHLFG